MNDGQISYAQLMQKMNDTKIQFLIRYKKEIIKSIIQIKAEVQIGMICLTIQNTKFKKK
jgi:hypothetical protein